MTKRHHPHNRLERKQLEEKIRAKRAGKPRAIRSAAAEEEVGDDRGQASQTEEIYSNFSEGNPR